MNLGRCLSRTFACVVMFLWLKWATTPVSLMKLCFPSSAVFSSLTASLVLRFSDNAWIHLDGFGSLSHHNGTTRRETGKETSSLIKQRPGVLERKHRRGTESDWQDEHMSRAVYSKSDSAASFWQEPTSWAGKDRRLWSHWLWVQILALPVLSSLALKERNRKAKTSITTETGLYIPSCFLTLTHKQHLDS